MLKAIACYLLIVIACSSCCVKSAISIQNRAGEKLLVHDAVMGKTVELKKGKAANFGDMVELNVTDGRGNRWQYPSIDIYANLSQFWESSSFCRTVRLNLAISQDRRIYVINPKNNQVADNQPGNFPFSPKPPQ
jgi:hypothetical protein